VVIASMSRVLTDRWPTVARIATVPALLAIGLFDDVVQGVVVAAVLYLAWGGTAAPARTGRLGHAAWDLVHFRANRVVPRWWSEWCVARDVLLAAVLLLDP
jgi:hypothetical protein